MAELRVLLIDDDEGARRGLARYLRTGAGFEVVEYGNGAEALKHLASSAQRYTAILLDYVLTARLSGEQVLDQIHSHYPRLPVIVFTGRDATGGLQTLAKGAYRYLRRPINLPELENIIRGLAEQDMIYQEATRGVRLLLNSDMCLAWRLDRQERVLRVAAWDGRRELDEPFRSSIALPLDGPATKEFFGKGKPIYLRDVTDPKSAPLYQHREEARQRGWTSLISIPLMRGQRIIGLIDSYTQGQYEFPSCLEQARTLDVILPVFASQAAESIRNAELSNQFQTLHGINEILGGTFDVDSVIRQILSKAVELVGADMGWLFLADMETGKLVLRDGVGVPEGLIEGGPTPSEGVAEHVARTGEARNVSDTAPFLADGQVPILGVRSEVAVPLRREEETIGVLTVKSRFADAFTDDDVELLTALAAQAAIAIGRARLTEHLARVSDLALAGDFDQLAGYVVGAVRDLTGAQVALWLVSQEKGERGQFLRIVDHSGELDRAYIQNARVPLARGSSITALALETGSPIARDDILSDSEAPRFHQMEEAVRQGWHSFMTVPLLGRSGEWLGSLSLYSEAIGKFGPSEIELMRTFANQAGAALQSVQRQRTIQRLNQVGQSLMALQDSPEELKETLLRIAEAAMHVLEADVVNLYEYWADRDVFTLPPVAVGERWHPELEPTQVYEDDIVVRIVRSRERMYTVDVQGDPVLTSRFSLDRPRLADERFVVREGIVSSAAVPIEIEGKVLGVIFVNYRRRRDFDRDPELREQIEVFAHFAGAAIQNARLFDRSDVLREISSRINAALDLDEVPDRILDGLGEIVAYDTASLQLLQGDARHLVAGRGFDVKDANEWLTRPLSEDRLASRVVSGMQPVILSDTSDRKRAPDWEIRKETENVKSWVGLPLVYGGEVIGLVTLDHRKPMFYTQDLEGVLAAFANQAAVAIANARQYRRLEQLQAVSADISAGTLDVSQVLDAIANGLSVIFPDASCSIRLYNRKDRRFEPQVATGVLGAILGRPPRSRGSSRWVVKTGKPRYLVGPELLHPQDGGPKVRRDVRKLAQAVAYLPLGPKDDVRGVLYLDLPSIHRFTDYERRILELFANQAAIAIQNSQRRVGDVEVLREINAAIGSEWSGGTTLDHTMQLVADRLVGLFGAASCALRLYDAFSDRFGDRFASGARQKQIDFQPRPDGASRQIVRERKGIYAHDTSVNLLNGLPVIRPEVHERGIEAAAYLPLLSDGRVLGILYMDWDAPRRFSEYERRLLEAFAGQAAVAIRNARLLRASTARAEQLTQLQQVTTSVLSESDNLTQVLQRIVESLTDVLNAGSCAIRLYDTTTDEFTERVSFGKLQAKVAMVPRGEGSSRYALRNNMFLYTERAPGERPDGQPIVRPELMDAGVQAGAYLPLIAGERPVGMLYIYWDAARQIPDYERRVLELFAGQAAAAIQSARHRERQEVVAEVSRTVSTLGIDEILEQVHAQAAKIMDARNLYIALYDEGTDTVSFPLAYVEGGRIETGAGVWAPRPRAEPLAEGEKRVPGMPRYGLTEYVIDRGLAEASAGDMQTWAAPRRIELSRDIPTKSWIGAPLKVGDRVIGAISIQSYERVDAYDEDDRRVLEMMANQAAVAIENAKRYDQLERLHDVTALISQSSFDLDAVLRLIVESLGQVISGAECGIRLYDAQVDAFEPHVATGVLEGLLAVRPRPDGCSRYVVRTRQPRYLIGEALRSSPDTGPTAAPELVKGGAKTLAYLPLISKDDVKGVLYVYLGIPYPFSEHEKRIMELLAGQAAIAIENAEHYRILEVLAEVGRTVSTLGTNEILEQVYAQAAEIMDARNLYIAFYDEGTDVISFPLAYSGGERIDTRAEEAWQPRQRGRPLAQGQVRQEGEPRYGLTEYVIDQGTAGRLSGDPDEWATERRVELSKRIPTKSWIGAPLKTRDNKVIGVVSIQHHERQDVYDEDDLQALEMMANQAAVAIENAMLYGNLEDKVEERTRELVRAQNRLLTAERLTIMNHVAAEFMHRLGNLAGTIPVRVLLAQEKLNPEDATHRAIMRLLDGIRSDVQSLLKAARDLQQMPSGGVTPEPVNVNQLVRSVIARQPIPPGIHVSEALSPDLPLASVSKDQFGETVKNLLTNAIDAMPQGGTVTVKTDRAAERSEHFVRLEISDTGIGIPREEQERIFELFYTTKPNGLGYGLWRDRQQIETQGGRIEVESEPGKGAKFVVWIPVGG